MCRKVTSKSSKKTTTMEDKETEVQQKYEKDVSMFSSGNSRKLIVKTEAPDDKVTN